MEIYSSGLVNLENRIDPSIFKTRYKPKLKILTVMDMGIFSMMLSIYYSKFHMENIDYVKIC